MGRLEVESFRQKLLGEVKVESSPGGRSSLACRFEPQAAAGQ